MEWYTPAWLFDALGLRFDLDPCSPGAAVVPWVPADRHYTVSDDGLEQPWSGLVWMNPPYGQRTKAWMRKFAQHGNGVALVFARTDTAWFDEYVAQSECDSLVCFVRRRISFVNQQGKVSGTPGSGSMLVAMGDRAILAVYEAGLGSCWEMIAAGK